VYNVPRLIGIKNDLITNCYLINQMTINIETLLLRNSVEFAVTWITKSDVNHRLLEQSEREFMTSKSKSIHS